MEDTLELFTIGHSNHPADTFVALLKKHKIDTLVDVRSAPRSRWPQFSRDGLIALMKKSEVTYLYGGGPLGGQVQSTTITQLFVDKMERVISLAGEGKRVALMCSEGKPCECHRAGKLTRWLHTNKPAIKTTHILPKGELVDAKEYEPQVIPDVRWPEFLPWKKDLFFKN
jgi:uncharacterized protein (DUF488 family)